MRRAQNGLLRISFICLVAVGSVARGADTKEKKETRAPATAPSTAMNGKQLQAAALSQVYNFLEAAIKDPAPWSEADRSRMLTLLQQTAPLASAAQKAELLAALATRYGPELKICTPGHLTIFQNVFSLLGASADQQVELASQWVRSSDQWRSLSFDQTGTLIVSLRRSDAVQSPEGKQVLEYALSSFLSDAQWRLNAPKALFGTPAQRFAPSMTPTQQAELRKSMVAQFFTDPKLCSSLVSSECTSLISFCVALGANQDQANALLLTWLNAGDNWKKEPPEQLLAILPSAAADPAGRTIIAGQIATYLSNEDFLKQARQQGRLFPLINNSISLLTDAQRTSLLAFITNEMGDGIPSLAFVELNTLGTVCSNLGAKPSQVAGFAHTWMVRDDRWKTCPPEQLLVLIRMLALDPDAGKA